MVQQITRQEDDTCLVESMKLSWKGVIVWGKTIEIIEPTRRKKVKELDSVLVINGESQDRTGIYVNGFEDGVASAAKQEGQFQRALDSGNNDLADGIKRGAKEIAAKARHDANEQLKVGNRGLYHPDLLVGRADGLDFAYREIGILP